MAIATESATFTKDVFCLHICNTFQEAVDGTTPARPFDVVVVEALQS